MAQSALGAARPCVNYQSGISHGRTWGGAMKQLTPGRAKELTPRQLVVTTASPEAMASSTGSPCMHRIPGFLVRYLGTYLHHAVLCRGLQHSQLLQASDPTLLV